MIDPNRYPALWHLLTESAANNDALEAHLPDHTEPPSDADELEDLAKTLTSAQVESLTTLTPAEWRYVEDQSPHPEGLHRLYLWLLEVDGEYDPFSLWESDLEE